MFSGMPGQSVGGWWRCCQQPSPASQCQLPEVKRKPTLEKPLRKEDKTNEKKKETKKNIYHVAETPARVCLTLNIQEFQLNSAVPKHAQRELEDDGILRTCDLGPIAGLFFWHWCSLLVCLSV